MTDKVTPALSFEALLGKSRVYILRALAAKDRGSLDEYQLWASLALELLGKSALAKVHPCLVADPLSAESLFAAAGMHTGTNIKTVAAKTLFDRLTHLSKRFDTKTKEFCEILSLKRNAELHSGELPFEATVQSAWEGRFWHTAHIILEMNRSDLAEWLGATAAKAPAELVKNYVHALREATRVRIETHRDQFKALKKAERDLLVNRAAVMRDFEISPLIHLVEDGIWETTCPACASRAFLAGNSYSEEVSESSDDPFEETVEVAYVAEELLCPACNLRLESREEIEAAKITTDHFTTETREREYEQDYGND